MNLRTMQGRLPAWGVDEFRHALTHATKALGALSSMVDDADHTAAKRGLIQALDGGQSILVPSPDRPEDYPNPHDVGKYVGDLVACALKMAQRCPSGPFDLEDATIQRILEKNPRLDPAAFLNGSDSDPSFTHRVLGREQILQMREVVLGSAGRTLNWADFSSLLRAVAGDRGDITPNASAVLNEMERAAPGTLTGRDCG
jgi:hypothetical protein